ncbi:MAG: hypothetical protein Q7T93_02335 [Methylobacterium sp.]|uniref:pentapeptide repeat-containing protein n=1 Tax=Methylobacterium sp. TaxID=409 RepID=UPI00271F740D|nr:hypothetical protein [Methylobacterium sp.]MDO9425647.1 hypothetical protein [Methylobacterium sp.]
MEKTIHAILTAENVDFEGLLNIAELDPATDLRGCDFRGVDFGSLTAKIIDLSRCDLTDADLSHVQGTINLRGALLHGAKLPAGNSYNNVVSHTAIRMKFSLLKQILVSAHRFYLPSRVEHEVARQIERKNPVLTCYRSHTEHPIVENSICEAIKASLDEKISLLFDKRVNKSSISLIEIYGKSTLSRISATDVASLDAAFFDSLRNCHVRKLFNKRVEVGYIARIVDNFRSSHWNDSSEFRDLTVFSKNIDGIMTGRSRFVKALSSEAVNGLNIFLMNGLSPFSEKIYKLVERDIPNARFVWILPSNALYDDVPRLVKSKILPNSSIIYPADALSYADLVGFIKRFEAYQKHGLIITDETKLEILQFVNKPVSSLKNMFISKIMEIAQSRNHENGSIII